MTTPTHDRRRALVDLFPQFLMRRRQGWAGLQPLLEASQLARPDYFLLRSVVEETDLRVSMSEAELRTNLFNPYATINPIFESLPALVEGGYLSIYGDRYTVTLQGRALVDRVERAARAYLATRALLPAAEGVRLADTCSDIASRLWSAAEPAAKPHQARVRRLPPTAGSPPIVRLELAVYALWMARDDAHNAAWRAAGFDGPALDLLSRVWAGEASTVTELIACVRQTQHPEDVDRGLATLIAAGYIISEENSLQLTLAGSGARAAIEEETDRIYFAPWPPLAPGDIAWLYQTFHALRERLL
jgi:hypothetical protein